MNHFIFSLLFTASVVLSACTPSTSTPNEPVDNSTSVPDPGPEPSPAPTPQPPPAYTNFFKSLTTGGAAIYTKTRHTCGITQTQNVICWGNNAEAQLGNPDSSETTFLKVLGGDQGGESLSNVQQITLGQGHGCALTEDGKVYCWGNSIALGAGNSVTEHQFTPKLVLAGDQSQTAPALENIVSIDAGYSYTCALALDRSVYCWGLGKFLGDGSVSSSSLPRKVLSGEQGLGTHLKNITSLDVGFRGACAVDSLKNVYCWGNRMGTGSGITVGNALSPVKVLGGDQGGTYLENIKQVMGGWNLGCAVDESGALYCWGKGVSGLAADANLGVPSRVLKKAETAGAAKEYLENVETIAGGAGICATLKNNDLLCWGLFTSQPYPTALSSDAFPAGKVKNIKAMNGEIGTFWFFDRKGNSYGYGVNYFNTFRGFTETSTINPILYDETGPF